MLEVYVHPHVSRYGFCEQEILQAWANYVRSQQRSTPNEDQIVRVGYGNSGAAIQMIGVRKDFGVLIIHAMTPPKDKVLKELGISRR